MHNVIFSHTANRTTFLGIALWPCMSTVLNIT